MGWSEAVEAELVEGRESVPTCSPAPEVMKLGDAVLVTMCLGAQQPPFDV